MKKLNMPIFVEKFYKERKNKNYTILLLIVFFAVLFFAITILRMDVT